MLAVNKYPQDYIDACKATVRAQVKAFKALSAAAAKGGAAGAVGKAVATMETVFFNNLVIVMDAYFVHRTRTLELKDGNPLNEVRILCASMITNNGRLAADKAIKLDPARSVLGLDVGDEVALTEKDFDRLAKAFFLELEAKFS